MKRNLLGCTILSGICICAVMTGFFSSRKIAEVTPMHLPPHSLLLTIEEVNTESEPIYQATITSNDTQWVSPPLIKSRDLGRLLAREGMIYTNACIGAHKQLFQTLRKFIASTIVPHDTIYTLLNGLSWNLAIEAIPMDSADEYLCDRYCIKRISSVKQINHHPVFPDTYSSILFGDIQYNSPTVRDLQGSKHAIAYLRELYSARGISAEIYSQDAATAEAFGAVSGRDMANILVSTHGEIRAQSDCSKAYEVLFDNATGVPTCRIAKMDLSHIQTIFFTSCHSGCFSAHSDECLRTALKKAGANSLIMHIWRTNDKAAEIFINTYYAAWLSGQTPREAFRNAQNTVRAQMKEPLYWAGFIMLD